MSNKKSFPWWDVFKYYVNPTKWVSWMLGFGLASCLTLGHFDLSDPISTIGSIIGGGIGMYIFFVVPGSVIAVVCRYLTHTLPENLYKKEYIMTSQEGIEAINSTIQAFPEIYAEIVAAAMEGNTDILNERFFDDLFLEQLHTNILAITGAQLSLDDTRKYFSDWFFSQKGDDCLKVMTDAECLAAMEETMQSVGKYKEIVTAAENGDVALHNGRFYDDNFIKELQANIAMTTGARMSLSETRLYYSEWYFSKKDTLIL